MSKILSGILWAALIAGLSVNLYGCGGGGGGGDSYVGAAIVSIRDNPSRIDTGSRTLITSEVSEVDDNGIALKFRYPAGLGYVRDSAFLEVDGLKVDLSPAVSTTVDPHKFLVFFLSRNLFGRDNRATVSFELEGLSGVNDGEIEVDADVDDPLVANPDEFDPQKPEFTAQDQAGIEVVG